MTRVGTTTEQATVTSTLVRHRRRRARRPDVAAGRHRGRAGSSTCARRCRGSRPSRCSAGGCWCRAPRTRPARWSPRLRGYGAVPDEVPTISVEPPRNPLQMDKAVRGLVEGRYEWIAFTSVNAVKAVREKFEEYGLDARAFSGLKIAAVGDKTAQAIAAWGLRADLVPSAEPGRQSAAGLLAGLAGVRRPARPDQPGLPAARRHRDRDAGRRADRPRLGGRRRDGVPHRPRDAAAGDHPRRDQDRQVRRGRVHVVLDGAQPGRHRRQAAPVDGDRGDRAGHGQDRRGARPAGRRPGPEAGRRRARRRAGRLRRRPPDRDAGGRRAGHPTRRSASRRRGGARLADDARGSPPGWPGRWSGRGGCGVPPGCAGWSPRPRSRRRQLVLPLFVREGIDRAGADRVHARRRPAHARHPAQGGRRGGRPGARRRDAVRHPRAQGRRRLGRHRPGRHPQPRHHRRGRRGRRRAHRDERPVPRRVHRPRPLRGAHARRPGRQRPHPRGLRRDGPGPCRRRRRHGRPQRDDGRPGPGGPRRPGRRRAHRRLDPGLLGEVRLRLLRPVPRGRRRRRWRATGAPTSRTPPTPSRESARRCSTSSRAPTS